MVFRIIKMNRLSHVSTHAYTQRNQATVLHIHYTHRQVGEHCARHCSYSCLCLVSCSLFPVPELICGRLYVFVMPRPKRGIKFKLTSNACSAITAVNKGSCARTAREGRRRSSKGKGKQPRQTFFLRSAHLIFSAPALLTFDLAFLISLRRTQAYTYAQSPPPLSPPLSRLHHMQIAATWWAASSATVRRLHRAMISSNEGGAFC